MSEKDKDPKHIAMVAMIDAYEQLMEAWDVWHAADHEPKRERIALQLVAGMCDVTKTAAHAYSAVVSAADRNKP